MTSLPLSQWVDITASSNMPLYAVLNSTGASQAVQEYYIHDGTATPYGLYSGTPYADWFSVMPMIVPLSNNSPFLDWVASTEHTDWGWLARSPFTLDIIAEHLRGLTQVIMPTGETVFFRYWDGEYMAEHVRFMGDKWSEVLPAFPFYWINGEHFTVHISAKAEAQVSPWWQVPQALIDSMLQTNTKPLLESIMQILSEDYPAEFLTFSQPVLKRKIQRVLEQQRSYHDMDGLFEKVLQALKI